MAHTKQLLDAGSIDNLIDEVSVTQEVFQNEQGQAVKYNRVVIKLDNGDTVGLKATPELKMAVYYATRELEQK